MAIRTLTVLVLSLVVAAPASAAKWEGGCPAVKSKLWAAGRGWGGSAYTASRYFEHVGHDVTYVLKAGDVERNGGFSTDPGGNTVQVTFTPRTGAPIALPPFTVTATSPSMLTITIPDSRPIIGRLLVGPATITVTRAPYPYPFFETRRLLILPPMNDVHMLTTDGYDIDVLAAMDKGGRVWIPLDFNGYGQGGEQLPECPTPLTPVTPFALDFSLKKSDEQALPYVNFGLLKKHKIFLGDYVVFNQNMYGSLLKTKLDMKPSGDREIVMCALNDALQLVLMFGLQNKALGDKSSLLALVSDGSPVTVKIENITDDPEVAERVSNAEYDSSHLTCYHAP